jgi:hypothetical protein
MARLLACLHGCSSKGESLCKPTIQQPLICVPMINLLIIEFIFNHESLDLLKTMFSCKLLYEQ